ncbi:MAG: hypothetical protein IAA97_03460 [Spirochaetes bacterium]|uniref:Uncharacterized protein n=1 Tax=Candidatus Ornithospirochaeta stercoripullorum TaxID=2840899 RepID=A0A9D9DZP9_9SPIO|nr:hypothetical protein [Candidatus Ornithospirochaeta stercoripullorum]
MASFTVDIGTEPLAEHVDVMTSSVRQVSSSVDTMSNRLVAAEQMAAERVSTNVTYGFYMLTRNQFMQKAIALENDVLMTFSKVQTYSENLKEIKKRMEKDYANISRQYLKIFSNIDGALKNSIRELDQGLVEVAVDGRQKLTERRLENSVKVIAYPDDILMLSQTMVSGKLKKEAEVLLSHLFALVEAQKTLGSKMQGSLSAEQIESDETLYFPVVMIETENQDEEGSYVLEIRMPNFPEEISTQSGSVYSRVVELKDDDIWQKGDKTEVTLVRSEFNKLLSSLDPRKREIMQTLFESSEWKELRKE